MKSQMACPRFLCRLGFNVSVTSTTDIFLPLGTPAKITGGAALDFAITVTRVGGNARAVPAVALIAARVENWDPPAAATGGYTSTQITNHNVTDLSAVTDKFLAQIGVIANLFYDLGTRRANGDCTMGLGRYGYLFLTIAAGGCHPERAVPPPISPPENIPSPVDTGLECVFPSENLEHGDVDSPLVSGCPVELKRWSFTGGWGPPNSLVCQSETGVGNAVDMGFMAAFGVETQPWLDPDANANQECIERSTGARFRAGIDGYSVWPTWQDSGPTENSYITSVEWMVDAAGEVESVYVDPGLEGINCGNIAVTTGVMFGSMLLPEVREFDCKPIE